MAPEGVAPRVCVRVYTRVLVPPNPFIHTYAYPSSGGPGRATRQRRSSSNFFNHDHGNLSISAYTFRVKLL